MSRIPASLSIFVLTTLLVSTQKILESSSPWHDLLLFEHTSTRICMSGSQYAARSLLIFSDGRSWDAGLLLFDHRVWNEDEKPQALLRSTSSPASVKVRVCMQAWIETKILFSNFSLYCPSASLTAYQKDEEKHSLDNLKPLWDPADGGN